MPALTALFQLSLIVSAIAQSGPVGPTSATGLRAQEVEKARLSACIALIETDPVAAYEEGLTWSYEGARPGARQCTALALIGLGKPLEGAMRLEALAAAPDAGDLAKRSDLLAQAGAAYLIGGAGEASLAALDAALNLTPPEERARIVALQADKGRALLLLGRAEEAETALTLALDGGDNRAETWRNRARAYLALNNLTEAAYDANEALVLEPDNIEGLVLRGDVIEARRLAGLRPSPDTPEDGTQVERIMPAAPFTPPPVLKPSDN
jgi:tetratricopeptide (TPR) repeat protein